MIPKKDIVKFYDILMSDYFFSDIKYRALLL